MSNKEFWAEVSFSGIIRMSVVANNEEEAKEKIFESITGDFDSNNKDISVEEVEWDLIEKEPSGNVKTPFVEDFHIEEQD